MCNGILMGKIVEEEKYCKDFICRYNLHNLTNAKVYRLMKEDLWKNYSFSVG
jgi:hypothetical protein